MNDRKFTVIGHRGAAALAPENTLAGLRRAAEHGVRWVEVDVQLTADGVPMLIHDYVLDRTTNGRGRVSRTPLARIEALDGGSWFGPSYAGEPVPTLERAIETMTKLGLGVNFELKAGPRRANAVSGVARPPCRSSAKRRRLGRTLGGVARSITLCRRCDCRSSFQPV